MERLRLSVNVTKVTDTGAVVTKNMVDHVSEYDRLEGQDGYTFRLKNSDGAKTIDLSELDRVNLLIVEGEWAESDTTTGAVQGSEAPLLISVNGAITPVKTGRMILSGLDGVTSLSVQGGDAVNDAVVKARIICSSR